MEIIKHFISLCFSREYWVSNLVNQKTSNRLFYDITVLTLLTIYVISTVRIL